MIDKSSNKIKNMFDSISSFYDNINNIISFFTHKIIKKLSVLDLKILNNSNVLDLFCGTGDMGRIVSKLVPDAKISGLDFSSKMIEIAKQKNQNIKYYISDASNMPFDNETFNYVIASFGLRNVENFNKVVTEIYRVTKNNGYFLHLDFGKSSFFSKIYDKIALFLVSLYKKDTTPYKYLIDSKNEFYNYYELIEKLKNSGFECIKCKNYFFNIISYQIFIKKSP